MYVCLCGSYISDERYKTGARTCIKCGDLLAKNEIEEKHSRIGYVYNKGPEQYLGSAEEAKHILKTGGSRKHLPIPSVETQDGPRSGRGNNCEELRRRHEMVLRRATGTPIAVGVYWKGGEKYTLYEDETPPKGATRVALFNNWTTKQWE